MFAYCLNNPINYFDFCGDSALPIPSLVDFYYMHKEVQLDVAEEYGYAIEVYVRSPFGGGYLDIYDAEHNQYYEVKSKLQAGLGSTTFQMEKYDSSHISDIRFFGFFFSDSPQRGTKYISGRCQYSYWDIYYKSNGNGLITYEYKVNDSRYNQHLAAMAVIVIAAAAGCCMPSVQHETISWNMSFACIS